MMLCQILIAQVLTTSNKENEQQNSAEVNATDNKKSLVATIDRTAKCSENKAEQIYSLGKEI